MMPETSQYQQSFLQKQSNIEYTTEPSVHQRAKKQHKIYLNILNKENSKKFLYQTFDLSIFNNSVECSQFRSNEKSKIIIKQLQDWNQFCQTKIHADEEESNSSKVYLQQINMDICELEGGVFEIQSEKFEWEENYNILKLQKMFTCTYDMMRQARLLAKKHIPKQIDKIFEYFEKWFGPQEIKNKINSNNKLQRHQSFCMSLFRGQRKKKTFSLKNIQADTQNEQKSSKRSRINSLCSLSNMKVKSYISTVKAEIQEQHMKFKFQIEKKRSLRYQNQIKLTQKKKNRPTLKLVPLKEKINIYQNQENCCNQPNGKMYMRGLHDIIGQNLLNQDKLIRKIPKKQQKLTKNEKMQDKKIKFQIDSLKFKQKAKKLKIKMGQQHTSKKILMKQN